MQIHPHVLVVGRDQLVLHTRSLILGTYFDVEIAGRLCEAAQQLSQNSFSLVVLCDTLSDSECSQIAGFARECKPQPSLLSLLRPGASLRNNMMGCHFTHSARPTDVLRECASVLNVNLNEKQRGLRRA